MKQSIGTKIVEAAPALRYSDGKETMVVELGRDKTAEEAAFIGRAEMCDMGYRVRYPDGYESWSPVAAFEEAYRHTDAMPFGLAIEAAKKGCKIARRGWNGKNQYVELATAISYQNAGGAVVKVEHSAIGNQALAFVGTSGVQMGWLASQADMLADDWMIV